MSQLSTLPSLTEMQKFREELSFLSMSSEKVSENLQEAKIQNQKRRMSAGGESTWNGKSTNTKSNFRDGCVTECRNSCIKDRQTRDVHTKNCSHETSPERKHRNVADSRRECRYFAGGHVDKGRNECKKADTQQQDQKNHTGRDHQCGHFSPVADQSLAHHQCLEKDARHQGGTTTCNHCYQQPRTYQPNTCRLDRSPAQQASKKCPYYNNRNIADKYDELDAERTAGQAVTRKDNGRHCTHCPQEKQNPHRHDGRISCQCGTQAHPQKNDILGKNRIGQGPHIKVVTSEVVTHVQEVETIQSPKGFTIKATNLHSATSSQSFESQPYYCGQTDDTTSRKSAGSVASAIGQKPSIGQMTRLKNQIPKYITKPLSARQHANFSNEKQPLDFGRSRGAQFASDMVDMEPEYSTGSREVIITEFIEPYFNGLSDNESPACPDSCSSSEHDMMLHGDRSQSFDDDASRKFAGSVEPVVKNKPYVHRFGRMNADPTIKIHHGPLSTAHAVERQSQPCNCGIPLRAECGKLYRFEHECECRAQQIEYKPYARTAENRGLGTKKKSRGPICPCEDRQMPLGIGNAQQGKLTSSHPNDKCESLLYMRNASTNSSVSTLSGGGLAMSQKNCKTSCHCCACLKQNEKDKRMANSYHKNKKKFLSPVTDQPQIFSKISCSHYPSLAGQVHETPRKTKTKIYAESNRVSSRNKPQTCICPTCGLKHLPEVPKDGPVCSFCRRQMQANNQCAIACTHPSSDKENQGPVGQACDGTCLKYVSGALLSTESCSRASSVRTCKYSSDSRAEFEFKARTRAQCPDFSPCSSNRSVSCICASVCTIMSTNYLEDTGRGCRPAQMAMLAKKPASPARTVDSRRHACHLCKSEPVISFSSCDRPYNYDTEKTNQLCHCETPAYTWPIKAFRQPDQVRSARTGTTSKNLAQTNWTSPISTKEDSIEICSCEHATKSPLPAQKQTEIHSYGLSGAPKQQQTSRTYPRNYKEPTLECKCGPCPIHKNHIDEPGANQGTTINTTSERVATKSGDPYSKDIDECDCKPCECSPAEGEAHAKDSSLKPASQASSCQCINCKCARRPPSPNKELKEVGLCTVCKCEYEIASSKPSGPHPVQCLCAECLCPDEADQYVCQYTSKGEVCRPPSATTFQSERIEKCPCPDCKKYIAIEGGHHVKRVCSDQSEKSTQSKTSDKPTESIQSAKTDEAPSGICICSGICPCKSEETPSAEDDDGLSQNENVKGPDVQDQDADNEDVEDQVVENPDDEDQEVENSEDEDQEVENQYVADPDVANQDKEKSDAKDQDEENQGIKDPDIENQDAENQYVEDQEAEDQDVQNGKEEHQEVGDQDVKDPDLEDQFVEDQKAEYLDMQNEKVEYQEVEYENVKDADIENQEVEETDVKNPDVENQEVEYQVESNQMIQEQPDQLESMNDNQADSENPAEIVSEKQLNEKEEISPDVRSHAQYAGDLTLKSQPGSCINCPTQLKAKVSSSSGPCSCLTETGNCSCLPDVTQPSAVPENNLGAGEPTTSTVYSSVFSGAPCSGECVMTASAETASLTCECSMSCAESPLPTVLPIASVKSEPKAEVVGKPVRREPILECPTNCGCKDCPFLNPKPKAPKKKPPPCLPPIPSALMRRKKPDLSCSEALDQIRNIVCFGASSERCECRCGCKQSNLQGICYPPPPPPSRCICFPEKEKKQCKQGFFGSQNFTLGSCGAWRNGTLKAAPKVGSEYLDKATCNENTDDELLGVNAGLNCIFGFLFSEIKNIKDMLNCGLQKIDARPCETAPPAIEYGSKDFVTIPPLPALEPCTGPAFVKTLPPGCSMHPPPCTHLTPIVTITGVQSVGSKSLLITWIVDQCRGVVGYEVFIDGCLKSRSYSPARTSAVAYGVDLSVSHVVTVVAVVDESLAPFGLLPTQGSFSYQPNSGPRCIFDCFT